MAIANGPQVELSTVMLTILICQLLFAVVGETPAAAQHRLADALASADTIHAVQAHGDTYTFAITRADTAFEVIATTSPRGDVIGVAVTRSQPVNGLGGLSWLATELDGVAAARLTANADGEVTLSVDDGRRYRLIADRGGGRTNTAAEARWAAEWDN
jgi:hypothetical protein